MNKTGYRPVIVLCSGRCGSTMLSNIMNSHPDILSVSEFFTFHSVALFSRWRMTGSGMWKILTRQPQLVRYLLRKDYDELLYPFDDSDSRFTRKNVPPVLCVTLPHLTDDYEKLFDDMEPMVRNFPRQSPANHCRSLFGWLCERFDRKVWVERSGGSSMYASRLMYRFPEAKIINMYRDGRETAISMSRHHPFRGIAPYILALQKRGYDPLKVEAKHSEFWEFDGAAPATPEVFVALPDPDVRRPPGDPAFRRVMESYGRGIPEFSSAPSAGTYSGCPVRGPAT